MNNFITMIRVRRYKKIRNEIRDLDKVCKVVDDVIKHDKIVWPKE